MCSQLKRNGVEMELSNDEFKILMAYRHKEELAANQACLKRALQLVQGRESLDPAEVRRLRICTEELDELMTSCGFLDPFDEEADRVDDDGEQADDDTVTGAVEGELAPADSVTN